jgi:hypothetical protein
MILHLSSAMGIFTSVFQDTAGDSEMIFGQVAHSTGSHFARFTYLAPDSDITSPNLSPLLEDLIHRVGERGAQNLTAEIDEKTQAFDVLRREHFSIYARQHIWRLLDLKGNPSGQLAWRKIISRDGINVRKLYHATVPTLVQQVEISPWERGQGWVLYQEGEMMAYAEVVSGLKGIWVQPFLHPEMKDVDQNLVALLKHLGPKKSRPVYICLRSYQASLSHTLEEVGAEASGSQAVMVRRLAATVKKPALAPIPQINGGTEPTTTYIKKTLKNDNGAS